MTTRETIQQRERERERKKHSRTQFRERQSRLETSEFEKVYRKTITGEKHGRKTLVEILLPSPTLTVYGLLEI